MIGLNTNKKQVSKILDFLRTEKVCVLSTVSKDGNPQSATMGFAETPELKVVFGTSNKTRKYQNLGTNQKVSIVVGWSLEQFVTVQYEGIAHEAAGEEIEWAKGLLATKNGESKKFANSPDNRYFIITPTWIRYLDAKANDKFELNL